MNPIVPFGNPVSLGNGTYTVTIYPEQDNPTSYLKTYRIVSVGKVTTVEKTIEIVVQQPPLLDLLTLQTKKHQALLAMLFGGKQAKSAKVPLTVTALMVRFSILTITVLQTLYS